MVLKVYVENCQKFYRGLSSGQQTLHHYLYLLSIFLSWLLANVVHQILCEICADILAAFYQIKTGKGIYHTSETYCVKCYWVFSYLSKSFISFKMLGLHRKTSNQKQKQKFHTKIVISRKCREKFGLLCRVFVRISFCCVVCAVCRFLILIRAFS